MVFALILIYYLSVGCKRSSLFVRGEKFVIIGCCAATGFLSKSCFFNLIILSNADILIQVQQKHFLTAW